MIAPRDAVRQSTGRAYWSMSVRPDVRPETRRADGALPAELAALYAPPMVLRTAPVDAAAASAGPLEFAPGVRRVSPAPPRNPRRRTRHNG
ncbi:MAG TPA: hypothetical protein VFE14_06750 [Micromonosporaceae bacterium]|jgi:hypothetical protein|nr:hypothetical protein [Micromonosporaceae bacterium]